MSENEIKRYSPSTIKGEMYPPTVGFVLFEDHKAAIDHLTEELEVVRFAALAAIRANKESWS